MISTGDLLTACWIETGPRIPTDTSSPLKANTWPNARTSIHCLQAISLKRSRLAFFFLSISAFSSAHPSARSFRLVKESSDRSSDCTKTRSPISWKRLRILRLMHTSEISPYPSKFSRGRFPFKGSPLGFALVTEIISAKSILPFKFVMFYSSFSPCAVSLSGFCLKSSAWLWKPSK